MTKKSVRLETLQKIRNKSFYLELTDNGNCGVSFFRSPFNTEQGPLSTRCPIIYFLR